ncbi:MAG: hypothetical protein Q4B03_05430 [Lachnospiraceae bacterium]|nr:hypothetical protein [Lachnospiraceae bacterium]
MKEFNTTATCIPGKHYMVDISERLYQIKTEYVDKGKYFTMNRGRQYGKTTTLYQLKKYLSDEYYVLLLSFEGKSGEFVNESRFVRMFQEDLLHQLEIANVPDNLQNVWKESIAQEASVNQLGKAITRLCRSSERPIILMIDEVDASSEYRIMLDFLGLLRNKYISASQEEDFTFQSVILSSVYDIKNLKLRFRPDEQHRYNSPWNIAADFDVDMAFTSDEIQGMIREYCIDHRLTIDLPMVAQQIYDYTSGYPYLVSRICQLIDTTVRKEYEGNLEEAWSLNGFQRAVMLLLSESNTLFDDLNKKLNDNAELYRLIRKIVIDREEIPFNIQSNTIQLGSMFGWLRNSGGKTVITNRIFEVLICNKMIQEHVDDRIFTLGSSEKSQLKSADCLYMDQIMERFAAHYHSIYGDRSADFLEKEARLIFLTFIKPIINGEGNYYLESQEADSTRTDVIIDYHAKQYIVELKIWHGDIYEQRGIEQLAGYLDRHQLTEGWLLSFCFNKNKQELTGFREYEMNGMRILETVV